MKDMGYAKYFGFTLIEIILVVFITSLLLVIAYPTYTSFILKSHRVDALIALTHAQMSLEHCHTENITYIQCDASPTFPNKSPQGFYRIRATDLGANTYTLIAIPTGNQINDTLCAKFVVDQMNLKSAVDFLGNPQSSCWSATS